MQKYNKAIVAILGGLVTVVAPFTPGLELIATPEIVSALGVLLTTFFVYLVPNRKTK